MKKLAITPIILILITSCGISNEEKERVASVTCSIIKESNQFESSLRVQKINEAREKIELSPYLDGDNEIKRSLEFGTCELLVTNDESYFEKTSLLEGTYLKEVARLAADKKAEEERLASEKKAEEEKLAAEKKKLAAQKKAEEKRLALELEAEKARKKARLLAEYSSNIELIKTQAKEACKELKLAEGTILIFENLRYTSEEEKNEIKTKYLKSITKDLPEEFILATILFAGYRNNTNSIIEKGISRLSGTQKRGIQCLDAALPKSCEAIMELPIAHKYFPNEKEAKILEVAENIAQCSELM